MLTAVLACTLLGRAHFAAPNLLIVDHLVIGQFTSKWKPIDAALAKRKMQLSCRPVGLGTVGKAVTVSGFDHEDATDGIYVGPFETAPGGVLVSGRTPSVPRPVKVLDNSNATYGAALAQWLKTQGINSPKQGITRIASVDLDGNGTQEIVIEASSRPHVGQEGMHDGKVGDYSVVLIRALVNGKVRTIPLQFDRFTKQDSLLYEDLLRGIADLDGDGRMEVVVSSDYYEGQSAMLFGFKGGKVTKLIETGAGV